MVELELGLGEEIGISQPEASGERENIGTDGLPAGDRGGRQSGCAAMDVRWRWWWGKLLLPLWFR